MRALPPLVLVFLAPSFAAAQDAPAPSKEQAKHALRVTLANGSGWTLSRLLARDVEANHRQKIESSIGEESHKEENEVDQRERVETALRTRAEYLEVEGTEVRRARFTVEESRHKFLIERDGTVLRKSEKPERAPHEGTVVTVRWGEDGNETEAKGGEMDDAEREAVVASFKFRDLNPVFPYLLPKEPVAVGETWAIEGRGLRQVLAQTLGEGEDEDRARKHRPKELRVDRELSGELKAKLVEVGEEKGRPVATISIEGKPKEEGSSSAPDRESTWTTTFDVKGTLVLFLDAGFPKSFEFQATAKTKSTHSGEVEARGMTSSFTNASEESMTYESSTTYAPLPDAPPPKKEG